MKQGDLVYFKAASTSAKPRTPVVGFKGHGYGVMLGAVPPFQKDPPAIVVMRNMGQIGFVSFDDVGEFLGPEAGAECVRKFEDKYYGKVVEGQEAAADGEKAEIGVDPALPGADKTVETTIEMPSKRIVGINGRPLDS